MADKPYPDPPRPTIEDLDPEIATTDRLIARVRGHRAGQEYPTAEQLLGNLPVVLRALCDHVLTGQASALDVVTGWRRSLKPSRATGALNRPNTHTDPAAPASRSIRAPGSPGLDHVAMLGEAVVQF